MRARNYIGHIAFLLSVVGVVSVVAAVLLISDMSKLTGVPGAFNDILFLVWFVTEVAAFIIGIVVLLRGVFSGDIPNKTGFYGAVFAVLISASSFIIVGFVLFAFYSTVN